VATASIKASESAACSPSEQTQCKQPCAITQTCQGSSVWVITHGQQTQIHV